MTGRKIKLLIIEPAGDLGGVSQFILSIIRYLPRERFDIHFAPLGNDALQKVLRQENISVHNLTIDYSALSFVATIVAFRKFLKRERYDVVHAHTAKAGLLGCLAKKGLSSKLIYTGHVFRPGRGKPFPVNVIFDAIEHFIYHSSDYVTVLSRHEYDSAIARGLITPRRAKIVSMSIDVNTFLRTTREQGEGQRKDLNIPPNAFVVGMIGRLTLQKDPESFVRVAALLARRIDNVFFLWVGDGDLREWVTRLTHDLGVSNRFIVTGQRGSGEIPGLLSGMDVLLFTSKFEGLPIAIMEAMAARKPIVAANVGCIGDIIKDGITGWLFEAGDFHKAASIVEGMYRNRQGLENIVQSAFDLVVDRHSPKERMAGEFDRVYLEVAF